MIGWYRGEIALAPTKRKFQIGHNAGDRGLSCTAEGVSLAGVPLLRRTISGLIPRPVDELAVLMKSAYGDDLDSTGPYPGLDVIAQALNKGDIGRAMVAAIHLRLPNLNEEGAAHIAWADEALKKYDPDQPRDWHGRWAADGGSSPNSPARSANPTEPASRPADLAPTGMKPILISDPGDTSGGAPVPSLLVNITLSRECVHNAHEPRYYEKTQACIEVMEQCRWLLQVNGENSLRRDACIWPDGAAAMMKFGLLVPFRTGHPF